MLLEFGCNLSHINRGEGPVSAKLGTATGHPVVDTEPSKRSDVIVEKTIETIVDGQRCVALIETVSDGSSSRSVHASCGSTDTGRN